MIYKVREILLVMTDLYKINSNVEIFFNLLSREKHSFLLHRFTGLGGCFSRNLFQKIFVTRAHNELTCCAKMLNPGYR